VASPPPHATPPPVPADGSGFALAVPAAAAAPIAKAEVLPMSDAVMVTAAHPATATLSTARRPAPALHSPDDLAMPVGLVTHFAPASPAADIDLRPAAVAAPSVLATQPERLAQDLGLAIARQVSADGNELHIRIEPVELGRIDVRMSFDDRGNLRAIIGADSGIALDLLRRDSADLNRAMADAGIRADSQSFRFDSRSEGRDGRGGDGGPTRPQRFETRDATAYPETPDPAQFMPIRWRNRVDILA
jgi:flagellar hook-length control protein FliK